MHDLAALRIAAAGKRLSKAPPQPGQFYEGRLAFRRLVALVYFLRHALRDRTLLRQVPILHFVYDESVERGDAIERLLAQARREQGEPD